MSRIPNYSSLGSGPVVLFLHGIGGGHLAFAPQLETFAAAGYRAVAWDMPGYGHSDPIEPYTFKGLAEKCIALIDALAARNGRQVSLVGHSMGGMVAQEVIARRPELVQHLILCGTSAAFGRSDGDWQKDFVQQRMAPLMQGQTMADLARQLVPAMAGPRALPEGLKLAEHCMSGVSPGTYRRALEALVTFDRRRDLTQISVPTLLVAGSSDPNAPPEVMRKMGERILRSQLQVMDGIGHLMNLESPDDFDEILMAFISENTDSVRH
jgi:pimeloyl-ACP methyl ester carboxylesterase